MIKSSKELIEDALKIFEKKSRKNRLAIVKSGFNKLDELTCGWKPGDLIIIAGRPGMGKFAFASSMIKNIAIDFEQAVAFFSLEMSAHNHITSMIASETGISFGRLELGKLESNDWKRLNKKLDNLSNAPIYIDDTPSLSISDLSMKASRLVLEKDVKIIVIDYLQLMTIEKSFESSRKEEIEVITRSLKNLAKELNIPIITLSQLSSTVETRVGSKRPILSDLSEYAEIEQNADIVCFMYRPEYYGFDEWDDEDGTPCEGQAELIVAKHRNGGLNNIRLKFSGHLGQFSDLD